MAYSKFTFDKLIEQFGIRTQLKSGLFADRPTVPVRPWLTETLDQNLPLLAAMGTEKARSELAVMPVLLEVWHLFEKRVSLFSGIEFPVDRKTGLDGFCDFLLALGSEQLVISAPVVALVETKKADPSEGVAQCIAEMIGAQQFNEKRGEKIPVIYGASTSGVLWRFLRLTDKTVEIDLQDYHIDEPGRIVGILKSLIEEASKARG